MKLKHKKLASALVLLSFLSYMPLSTTTAMAIDAGTLPDLNGSINGSVTTDGNRMDVVVNGGSGAVGQFDWNSFNVGSNGHVNFGFTANSQTSLNRVLASGGLSQIYGKLTNSCAGGDCSSYMGTGKVILINPNGIMFGNGAQVDLNSFTATTFDLKGAKNIKDMTADELAAYKNQINVVNGNPADMVMNAQFVRDGVLKTKDGAAVTVDGATMNIDKSLALAADNVNIYKDSLIKTNLNPNYGGGQNAANHDQSFSNVRIVTSDGVNFNYQLNGNIKSHKANSGSKVANNINIDGATIQSGAVTIENAGTKAGSDVNIKNSIVKGYKLVNNENGDIIIKGKNDVNIADTHLQTNNTSIKSQNKDTYSQNGGRIAISAGKNVNLKNNKIESAYANKDHKSTATGGNAGDITISANNGDVIAENTNVHAKGNLLVAAAGKISAKDSVLRARNYSDHDASAANLLKKVELTANNGVTLDNTYTESSDYTSVYTPGNIDVKNGSVMYTPNKALNLYGSNTTIADSTLVYNGLNFVHPSGMVNNVTIKGSTALNDKTPYADGLKLTTNGNLTIDNNSLLKKEFTATVDKDLNMNVTLGKGQNQDSITLESTGGKVTIKNNSDIKTNKGDITANALNSTKGEVFVQNSKLAAKGNINLNQALTHNAGTHITKDSSLSAKNINITTKNADADINADIDNFANLSYSERLALNAGRDNNITGKGNLSANRVDFNATRNNNINIKGNVTTNDVKFNGKVNNITATGNVTLKNTEIKAKDSAAPENTKTNINAGGNFTTDKTVLKVNGTKLIANADKDTNIVLAGANNKKAGIEINAKYNSNQLSNKTVSINAADNVLAISKIKSGNLNLDSNDTFLAALTDLTASDLGGVTADASGRAYIEVANWGKFNLDPMDEYETNFNQPDSFTYTDHFVPGVRQPEAGAAIDTYKKHFIEFDSNGVMEKFLLVYEKPFGCQEPPVVDPEDPGFDAGVGDNLDSLINQIRLPRQLEPTSRVAPIANNTTDPTTGIVNAAARIEVDDNATTNKKDDEFEI